MITELCIEVLNSFAALKTCLNTVNEHICILDKDLPAWFQPQLVLGFDNRGNPREQAYKLISQLEYLDGQQPREILVGAGVIAAPIETIQAIQALNAAKQTFKQAILNLKKAKIPPSELSLALMRMGLARVHLKQCYRVMPYFMQRPKKISWTWANTRSIKKISVATATELLLKHTQDAGIERQLKLLQGFDVNEKLAIVQDLAPHLRANIVMPGTNGDRRLMVKGPVPLFYLASDNILPELTPPKAKHGKDKDRLIRKDVKINPEPFLPAIRAHRYYENCK